MVRFYETMTKQAFILGVQIAHMNDQNAIERKVKNKRCPKCEKYRLAGGSAAQYET